jgi:RNA polymerase sigma-70 factor (ECF subfamily)
MVARRRAVEHIRRETGRHDRERRAMQDWTSMSRPHNDDPVDVDDQLGLLFACCHPALEPATRVTLTLRVVSGLSTSSIARLLLLPEATVAQRIVRAKRKIRDAGIRLQVPDAPDRPARLASVLHAVYLTFTEGHSPYGVDVVVRHDLCDEALRLARELYRLMPAEPEIAGLLAMMLLTAARAGARVDDEGALVLLAEQDRTRWDHDRIREGSRLIENALLQRKPGRYQLQAAIAACHADAETAAATDWRQIAALYGELLRFDSSAVVQANRAVAVAYAEGPAAGLAILDTLANASDLARWPALHVARAAFLQQLKRREEAARAYRDALALEPAGPVHQHITRQLKTLHGDQTA